MPRYFSLLIVFVACLIPTTQAHGQQQFNRTIVVDGVNRRYLVYLPTGFDPAESLPVMFHYHGGDSSPEEEIQYVDYRPLANQHGFIAVYPAASVDPDGCRCWNGEGPYSNGIDELGFTSAMLDARNLAESRAAPSGQLEGERDAGLGPGKVPDATIGSSSGSARCIGSRIAKGWLR